ncbi:glutathione-dependent formaldehyde-activating enzyme/centromere protein V, partial [Mycena epipterygia]
QVICHCTDCRQSSGSAFSTNILAPKKDVTITSPVKEFNMKMPSGNTVTHVLCSNCGSAVTHLTPAFGEAQAFQMGNFSDFAQIPINIEHASLFFLSLFVPSLEYN